MNVECFQGIKTEELHILIEKRNLGTPETVIIHMGMKDLRITRNLDFVVEVYTFFSYGKEETSELQIFPEWSVAR
jgi:hypothetical protein